MDSQRFWQEEMRRFPHGGGGAALWVARVNSGGGTTVLQLVYAWGGGRAREEGLVGRPPLGAMLRAVSSAREELQNREGDEALWVEPLLTGDRPQGCLAVWFDAAQAWRESVFLWSQELAPRLGSMLAQLSPVLPAAAPRPVAQPTLFPLPPVPTLTTGETGPRGTLPLPRPVMVPGIPGCVGVSREMGELGRRLGPVANSGVNVLLRGESGTGKEIVARALHECSDRRKGPFLGQNCAALPGQPLSVDYRVIPRRHAVYEASDCRGPGSIRYRPCTSKRALRASWG